MSSDEKFNDLEKLVLEQQEQMQKLQDELEGLKSKSKSIQVKKSPSISSSSGLSFKWDGEQFGQMIHDYVEGIVSSVRDSLEVAIEGVVPLGKDEFHTDLADMKNAAKELKRKTRFLRKWGISPEDYEKFYDEGAKLTNILADKNRLKLLKILENGPKYQKDLSEETGLSGGSFKHHMDQLKDEHFVLQEQVRGRYLLSQVGREALKLAEILWLRKQKLEKNPEEKPEETLEEE